MVKGNERKLKAMKVGWTHYNEGDKSNSVLYRWMKSGVLFVNYMKLIVKYFFLSRCLLIAVIFA